MNTLNRKYSYFFFSLFVLFLLSTACGGGGGGESSSTNHSEVTVSLESISKIADMEAPDTADFNTLQSKTLLIPVHQNNFNGTKVFLKMSYDENLINHFFLGEVNSQEPFLIDLELPKEYGSVYYEIYSNLGETTNYTLTL